MDVCARQRVVIAFLTAERCSPLEIHRRLTSVFVEDARDVSLEAMSVVLKSGENNTGEGPTAADQPRRRPETRLIC